MHYAARVVSLLVILISTSGVSSCQSTGSKEPDFYVCTVLDDKIAECVKADNTGDHYDIPIMNVIGYQCVAPGDYAELKTHHAYLHNELNKKAK